MHAVKYGCLSVSNPSSIPPPAPAPFPPQLFNSQIKRSNVIAISLTPLAALERTMRLAESVALHRADSPASPRGKGAQLVASSSPSTSVPMIMRYCHSFAS